MESEGRWRQISGLTNRNHIRLTGGCGFCVAGTIIGCAAIGVGIGGAAGSVPGALIGGAVGTIVGIMIAF